MSVLADEEVQDRVELLRRRSRELLARVDENSERIKGEVEKLRWGNRFQDRDEDVNLSPGFEFVKAWELRNNSNGVGGTLCPDYFNDRSDLESTSMPDVPCFRRIQLVSKKRTNEECQRKPVKGCYCNLQFRKTRSSLTKTQHKEIDPCKQCKSQFDFRPASQSKRNGQSRVPPWQNTEVIGDGLEPEAASICYNKPDYISRFGPSNIKDRDSVKQSRFGSEELNDGDHYSTCDRSSISDREKCTPTESQTKSRPSVKKTLSSKNIRTKQDSDIPNLGVQTRNKGTVTATSQESRSSLSKSKHPSKTDRSTSRSVRLDDDRRNVGPEYKARPETERFSDKQIEDIRKFREQNYFDTHGSSQLLHSPASSGSLDQYVLNQRMFPERVQSVHRKDLVVTIPPCATVQGKRVHYFPRYIVRQERNTRNANYKKRRCQTCPLTGHAVDLGVFKQELPINSLALKYQKRLT